MSKLSAIRGQRSQNVHAALVNALEIVSESQVDSVVVILIERHPDGETQLTILTNGDDRHVLSGMTLDAANMLLRPT